SHAVASDLRHVDGARRAAVWSRDADKAHAFAAENEFERAYDDFDLMLTAADIDIVYIATPHATHAPFALSALNAGKHVLIEKPIGVNAAEAQAIAHTARENELFAMEGMWMRFNPAYIALRAEARSGLLGTVSSVRAAFGLPFGAAGSRAWSAERKSSTLLDQAIYPVTLARDILGEPATVSSSAQVREDGVDLSLHVTLDYSDGRFAQLAASMVGYLEPTATISGTDGWATLAAPFWASDRFRRHSGDFEQAFGNPADCLFPLEGNGYVPMLQAVQDATAAGLLEHPLHPLDDSVAILTTLDRIRAAWPIATPF
ncbi:Gfo/Idh/MocA family protein, partial [Microbacterium sp. AGC62]